MLTATFFTLQASLNQVAYNIYLSALWLAIEAILLLLWMRMRSRYKDMDIRIISYEGKQMGYYRLEWCLILRFCKFMCAFFNFLGIVYAVKSMRHLKLVDWTTIICLVGFGFALHWLTMINFVISLFKSNWFVLKNASQSTIIFRWYYNKNRAKPKKCFDYPLNYFLNTVKIKVKKAPLIQYIFNDQCCDNSKVNDKWLHLRSIFYKWGLSNRKFIILFFDNFKSFIMGMLYEYFASGIADSGITQFGGD